MQIQKFVKNQIQGRSLIVILNLQVIGSHPSRIGTPVDVGAAGTENVPPPQKQNANNQKLTDEPENEDIRDQLSATTGIEIQVKFAIQPCQIGRDPPMVTQNVRPVLHV